MLYMWERLLIVSRVLMQLRDTVDQFLRQENAAYYNSVGVDIKCHHHRWHNVTGLTIDIVQYSSIQSTPSG